MSVGVPVSTRAETVFGGDMILSTAFRPNFFVSCLLVLLATQSATSPAFDVSTGIPVLLDKDNKVVGPVLDFP